MPPEDAVVELLQRIQAGSDEAADELVRRYGAWMRQVVASRIPKPLRRHFDSADFTQNAWASVFAMRHDFHRFRSSREFLAYVARLARNKVGIEARKRLASQGFDIQREPTFTDLAVNGDALLEHRGATPSQEAVASERWRQMLEDQPDNYRAVLTLRREGRTFPEIARELSLSECQVRRLYQRALYRENHG